MSKQRSKDEITGEYYERTQYIRTRENLNTYIIEGFSVLIEVLCDIRDNLKKQSNKGDKR